MIDVTLAELPRIVDWMRHEDWSGALVDILVSERAYTRRIDPVWLPLERVASGTASVYPLKATCTNGAPGQWKASEPYAVRAHPTLAMVMAVRLWDDAPWRIDARQIA